MKNDEKERKNNEIRLKIWKKTVKMMKNRNKTMKNDEAEKKKTIKKVEKKRGKKTQ
jgi:hypothetical protein